MSVASVIASFPATNSRARNGESSASSCENFTFHGQQLQETCQYTCFEIPLDVGARTVRRRTSSRCDDCLWGWRSLRSHADGQSALTSVAESCFFHYGSMVFGEFRSCGGTDGP